MASSVFFLVLLAVFIAICFCHGSFEPVGDMHPCSMDKGEKSCVVDSYIGTKVIYEDEQVRVWNFTLAPGEMTSMHRHDNDYHFVVIQPTQLQVWGEDGSILFDFRAEGTLGFNVVGEFLVPASEQVKMAHPVPRVHAAKNIGPNTYYEILFERKTRQQESTIDAEL